MGYFLRAFCRAEARPTLRQLLAWAEREGTPLEPDGAVALDSTDWTEAEVLYSRERGPIVLDVSRAGDAGSLLEGEIDEFVEALEDVDESSEKQAVLEHLRGCKAVVAAQLLGDIDDAGHRAAQALMRFFVQSCDAMIQADAEGFHLGEGRILEC